MCLQPAIKFVFVVAETKCWVIFLPCTDKTRGITLEYCHHPAKSNNSPCEDTWRHIPGAFWGKEAAQVVEAPPSDL